MKRILIILMVLSVSLACSSDGDDMGGNINSGGNIMEVAKGTFL